MGHLFLCPYEHLNLQFVAQGAWLMYTTLATSLGNTTPQPAPEIHKRKLRATFSKKAFWMPQEAPLDARVSSTLPPTTLLRSILCLSRTGFPILVASSVWGGHSTCFFSPMTALLLKMGSGTRHSDLMEEPVWTRISSLTPDIVNQNLSHNKPPASPVLQVVCNTLNFGKYYARASIPSE